MGSIVLSKQPLVQQHSVRLKTPINDVGRVPLVPLIWPFVGKPLWVSYFKVWPP